MSTESSMPPGQPPLPTQVACRQCGKLAPWQGNPFRPFCSERCKLIDLGDWAAERYALPADNGPDFSGEGDAGTHG